MTNLSPAAQAVLTAFLDTPGEVPMPMWDYGRDLAAALRTAVDQVVPLHIGSSTSTRGQTRLGIRHKLLAIAAELEALDDH